MPPSRQLTNSVAGSSTTSATRAAKCSRKNDSHTPYMPEAPSIITLSSRPVWALAWKLIGRCSTWSKIGRHLDHPPAVGKAVGMQRGGHAGGDREHAERRPGGEPGADPRPVQREAGALRPGELVDDPAKQHRLGELRHGQRDIGEQQSGRQPFLRPEPPEHPDIYLMKPMGLPSRLQTLPTPSLRVAFTQVGRQNHPDDAAEIRPWPRGRRRHDGRGGLSRAGLSGRAVRLAPLRAPGRRSPISERAPSPPSASPAT